MADLLVTKDRFLETVCLAIKSSFALHETIRRFRDERALKTELRELIRVSGSLVETFLDSPILFLDSSTLNLSLLVGLLQRCSQACDDRATQIRLQQDVEFTARLAVYRFSVSIALVDAGLRRVDISFENLDTYSDTVFDTADHLRAYLEDLRKQIERLGTAMGLQAIFQEWGNTLEVLHWCDQLNARLQERRNTLEVLHWQLNARIAKSQSVSAEHMHSPGRTSARNVLQRFPREIVLSLIDLFHDQDTQLQETVDSYSQWANVRRNSDVLYQKSRTA
nr:uncharacterized protein CTRU02_05602 [Colletotrichum truncatum]KAF6794045.1 hypothetical protein CTRU02_05602 [Colletotrichum truncatum]